MDNNKAVMSAIIELNKNNLGNLVKQNELSRKKLEVLKGMLFFLEQMWLLDDEVEEEKQGLLRMIQKWGFGPLDDTLDYRRARWINDLFHDTGVYDVYSEFPGEVIDVSHSYFVSGDIVKQMGFLHHRKLKVAIELTIKSTLEELRKNHQGNC